MKKDRDIFLPDTTVKLSSLKRVLNEVYELDIIELNKMDKKKQGGTLNSSVISFTQDDYNRLMDSNIFSSNKGERVFTISPKNGGRHLAKYNPDKQYLFVLGNKDLSNPIVVWLSENSYLGSDEQYKLEDGGTIDNQMENKLWYDIEKGIPHSFKYGGDIGYENYIVEFKKGSETRRVGILAHSQQEAVSKAKKMIGKGYSIGAIRRFAEGGGVMSNEEWRKYIQPKIENLNKLLENGSISFEQYQYALSNLQNPKPYSTGGGVGDEVYIEFLNKDKGFKKDVKHFKSYEEAVKWARKNFEKFNPDMIKHKFEKGGSCGCGSKFEKGGNTNCGCWHYEIGGL